MAVQVLWEDDLDAAECGAPIPALRAGSDRGGVARTAGRGVDADMAAYRDRDGRESAQPATMVRGILDECFALVERGLGSAGCGDAEHTDAGRARRSG